ncbi:MAG: hypothetical protein IIW83_02665, partial [Clostridia bacterium]|nr:hypothetical protein [Clostridia bacterium]
YITTDCYKNITVTNQEGTIKYNVSELNIIKDWGEDKTMGRKKTKTATITYKGEEYALVFNLNVMEIIQEQNIFMRLLFF